MVTDIPLDFDEFMVLLDDCFVHEYEAIRAFHACRPVCLDAYRRKGILQHSLELIEQLAVEAFGEYSTQDKIISAIIFISETTRYRVTDSGGVYCFTNQIHPVERGRNQYLRYGSEHLKLVANQLNLDGKGILNGRGTAQLIEVHVPISSVDFEYRVDFWRTMLTWHFKSEANSPASNEDVPSCFKTLGSISPDCIVGFIPVDDSTPQFW